MLPLAWRLLAALVAAAGFASPLAADLLSDVRARGALVWGGDQEGGGPYVYPRPDDAARVTGFEVELAELLAAELGVKASFFQGPWDGLPSLLETGRIDIVLNGYELTAARAARMEATAPYYVYELVLLRRKGDAVVSGWEDLQRRGGRRLRVGALAPSAAYSFLTDRYGSAADVVSYDGNTNAMREVETGKLDATVQDSPIALFYRDRFPLLEAVGQPVGKGHYVIYTRKGETGLRDALDGALARLLASGKLKALYERYGIWSAPQEELYGLATRREAPETLKAGSTRGWAALRTQARTLLQAAGMTVFLACASMPLAIALGLLVAVGRLYGPAPLRWALCAYVETLRGTPLMLQLYVLYFILPEAGLPVPALVAAIVGLGINYSAYEAEIYRAGILAVPPGQMEAALALGMGRGLALRRVVLPQAARMVIPPITNDFIALFKDTSVCSVITVMELTKQYNVAANSTGATVELAALTAILYLAMSLPLSRLASRLEDRQGRKAA